MSKSLTPAVRRQIIAFNPAEPGAPSVSQFCREVGVSRPSFYKVRDRFAREGNAALNPRSRAPKAPARCYDQDTVEVVLEVREPLTGNGWDAGPISIWHASVDEALFASSSIPSVSTIARILAQAGVVDANPRKRPRSSYIRFQRAAAMELWQLDALEYPLFDDTAAGGRGAKVTIYQLLDDSTRFDVGTQAYADPENGHDAVAAVSEALAAYGAPQQLLSDNGGAFNLARRGSVTPLQRLLADHGCRGITGSFRSPTTQGKDERSHQTVTRFLDAHRPTSLDQVREALVTYREYYNHRRHHQSLHPRITPAQAWDACEHKPSDGVPIPHSDLMAEALAYVDRSVAAAARPGEGLPEACDPQHTAGGRLRETTGQIVITRESPQIYLQGKIYKVPVHLVGSYMPVVADAEYALFDVTDGAESIRLPLPVQTKETGTRVIPLWKVRGARIRDPRPAWTQKHLACEAEHYPDRDYDLLPMF
jgi:transposase InsO family protein